MNSESQALDFSFVLASSVHDMKNSLGMLLSTLADVIEKYPPQDDVQAQAYSVLEYESARINSELVQLLSIYRLDHEALCAHIDECVVLDVISEQVARNKELFQSKGIALDVNCEADLMAYMDNDLIGGVINNILVNCSRYSKSKVRVCARKSLETLCLTIEDDGAGYPSHMLKASMDSGFGVGFSGGRPHLGLIFANKVAQLHKNKSQQGYVVLNNQSDLGGGCFSIFLP